MGNPHAVLFMDEIDSLDLETIGPKFEFHKRFPDRTNTEFVKVIDRTHVKMRVWERGSGETMACGTGACAVAVADHSGRHRRMRLRSSCWAAARDPLGPWRKPRVCDGTGGGSV